MALGRTASGGHCGVRTDVVKMLLCCTLGVIEFIDNLFTTSNNRNHDIMIKMLLLGKRNISS